MCTILLCIHSMVTFVVNIKFVQIRENGVISFGGRNDVRGPLSFPRSVIAPYWADVDIRGRGIGDIYYRQTTDPSLLARATSEIRTAFSNSQSLTIQNLLIATWYKVGYYNRRSDKVRC